jgi:hypothetical protein
MIRLVSVRSSSLSAMPAHPFTSSAEELRASLDDFEMSTASARYGHVGHFICWFGVVELHLTAILARALSFQDLERFDYLVRGMDAKTKIERLFGSSGYYCQLGPNLCERLERFKSVSSSIRNTIVHSWPHFENDVLHLGSIGSLPPTARFWRKTKTPAPTIKLSDLFVEAFWLRDLAHDLEWVLTQPASETLEIIEPRSGLPPEGHPRPLKPAPRARGRRRAGKPPPEEE